MHTDVGPPTTFRNDMLKVCEPFCCSSPARPACAAGWKLSRWPAASPRDSWPAKRSPKLWRPPRKCNPAGITVTLDHLGENVTSLDEGRRLARRIHPRARRNPGRRPGRQRLDQAHPVRHGLDETACRDNVERLVAAAARHDSFVRVDMESSAYTDRTLRLVTDLHARYGAVGTVIQAYLHRSEKDVEQLCRRESASACARAPTSSRPASPFEDKADVDRNFVRLMKILLESGRLSGHRHARRSDHRGGRALRRRAPHSALSLRIPDAVRHPARHAEAPRRSRAIGCASTFRMAKRGIHIL